MNLVQDSEQTGARVYDNIESLR